MRAFTALNLSDEAAAHLLSVQETLKEGSFKGSWSRAENLHLTLDKLGYFGEETESTLYCSLKADNNLKSLASAVRRAASDCAIRFDSKPFRAHITLGRRINILNLSLNEIEIKHISFPVEQITLYSSTLSPKGPVYRTVGSVFLSL